MTSSLPQPSPEAIAHSARLSRLIQNDISENSGWIPFSKFMAHSLYAPALGYYSAGASKFGKDGDFITAPELSTLFGRTLALQLNEIMQVSKRHILEIGAGSGKLAVDILLELEKLDALPDSYSILEVSGDLRDRQQTIIYEKLPFFADRVQWLDTLPKKYSGVIFGNEVLDALPVHLIYWNDSQIFERGVSIESDRFFWADRLLTNPNLLTFAQSINAPDDYLSEISLAAKGLVASLCERIELGGLLFIDYGFGANEYYHPQRTQGTLMCHYRHIAHNDPFFMPGLQDITAHVDFTAIAETAIDHGLSFLGYTSQAHFLLNNNILKYLSEVSPNDIHAYAPLSAQLQKLTSPAEMGELFKVIALGKGIDVPLSGFIRGDLSRLL